MPLYLYAATHASLRMGTSAQVSLFSDPPRKALVQHQFQPHVHAEELFDRAIYTKSESRVFVSVVVAS